MAEWFVDVPRPHCLPCRESTGLPQQAIHYGVACDWHFGILSDADQEALRLAVLDRHPKGGKVRNVISQIWVVRVTLRQRVIPNNVEAIWKADASEHAALQAEDYEAAQRFEDERRALVALTGVAPSNLGGSDG